MKRVVVAFGAVVLAVAAACGAFSGGDATGPTTDADASSSDASRGDATAVLDAGEGGLQLAWTWTGGGPGNDYAAAALAHGGAPYFVGTVVGNQTSFDAGGVGGTDTNGVVAKLLDDGGLAWVHASPSALGGSISSGSSDVIYSGFSRFTDGGYDFALEGLSRSTGESSMTDGFVGATGNRVVLTSAAAAAGGAYFIGISSGTGALTKNPAAFWAAKGSDVAIVQTFGTKASTVTGFQTSSAATPFSATVDYQGNLIIGGAFTSDVMIGAQTLTSSDEDGFVVKMAPGGGVVFVRQFAGANRQQILGTAAYLDRTVAVGRYLGELKIDDAGVATSLGTNLFVARLDAAGAVVWRHDLGPNTAEGSIARVAVDSRGNVIVGASFQGTVKVAGAKLVSAGGQDVLLAVLDGADGTALTALRFGGTGDDAIAGLEVGPSDEIYVAGSFTGTVDFGGSARTSRGGSDLYFMKLVR